MRSSRREISARSFCMYTLVGAGRGGAAANGAEAAGAGGRGVKASGRARGQAGSPDGDGRCDGGAAYAGAGGAGAKSPDNADGAPRRGAGASSGARFGSSKVFTREMSSCG